MTDSHQATSSTFRRLLGLSWHYWPIGLTIVLLNVTAAIVSVMGLGLTGVGIDTLAHFVQPTAAPNLTEPWRSLLPLGPTSCLLTIAAAMLVLGLILTALKYWIAVSSAKLSQMVVIQLRSDVYDKLQRMSFRFYEETQSSSLINRAATDVQAVRTFVDGVLFKVITVVLSVVCYAAYMAWVHTQLTLICLATTPCLCWGAVAFSRRVQPAYRRASQLTDQLIQTLAESIQGIQVVKGFALESHELQRFADACENVRGEKQRITWIISTFQPAMGLLTQINQAILIGYGGYLVITHQMALGTGLFVFANLLHEFANQVAQLTNIANSIQTSWTGAERVFEVLDAPEELAVPNPSKRTRATAAAIEFHDVCFQYGPSTLALSHMDLQVQTGEVVGIVGPTGAGKSTLLQLIPRFYDVSSGAIDVGGRDVREWSLSDLRSQIGIVFQDTFLFSNSIAANIAFGRPGATQEAIEHAARQAAAHEFICQQPNGYDTLLSEQGANLSGGQRQRLALARALLWSPTILLFDDVTAAVDGETEEAIQQSLARLLPGRTALIVSNRPSLLRLANRIVHLQQGQLVNPVGERGDQLREISPIAIPGDHQAPRQQRSLARKPSIRRTANL